MLFRAFRWHIAKKGIANGEKGPRGGTDTFLARGVLTVEWQKREEAL
jgi:hypothetical protein